MLVVPECESASILRGEVATREIKISFLAFVLGKKAVALSFVVSV